MHRSRPLASDILHLSTLCAPSRIACYAAPKMQSTTTTRVVLERDERSDTSVRWKPLWTSTYFVGLALATAVAFRSEEERPDGAPLALIVAAALFAGAWHWRAAVKRPHAHRKTRPMILWAVVAIAVTSALVRMAPVYLMAASFLYAQLFMLLPPRTASVAAMAFSALLWMPIASALGHAVANVTVGAALGACLLSGFVSAVIEQSRERRRTIAELREAEVMIADIERRAGRLEERARIARELHDTVTQDLVGITMELEAVADALPPEAPRTAVARLRDLSRGALADARGLVQAHRPRELEGASLRAALESLAERVTSPSVDVFVDEDVAVAPEHEAVLFRVAQEALSNARRHARASKVTITLSSAGSKALLDVHDDGIGFDPTASRVGFGVESMNARVRAAHGSLEIESERGAGTTVHVELPVVSALAKARP